MTISSHKSYVYKNKRQDQNGVESSLYQSSENSKVPPPPYKTLEPIFPVAKREERPPLQQLFHFVIVPLFELKLKVNIKDDQTIKSHLWVTYSSLNLFLPGRGCWKVPANV